MAYECYRRSLKPKVFDKFDLWRKTAKTMGLSKEARLRLEWMIFYHTKAQNNTSFVSRHFGINNSTFYKWLKIFDEVNLRTLETKSRRPKNLRSRKTTPLKDERIILLRNQYPYFGKMKLKVIYEKNYQETITSWYVQRVIETYKLYFKKKKKHYSQRKTSQIKKRITECETSPRTGFMIHLDSIVLHLMGTKRYIVTAIDDHSKIAYARMYKNHSSGPTKDFFHRLHFLLEEKIENVHTDNGSEFHKYFEETLKQMNLIHWWSRPRTPKDNPSNERFNQTLKNEFLNWGNFHPDPKIFNQRLTDWLIEYNSIRPHQSLNYLTPLEFAEKTMHLSTMWSSST